MQNHSDTRPNFPQDLDIQPSVPLFGDESEKFDFLHQKESIARFGIAGKVWKVPAEAAYALKLYVRPLTDHFFDPPFLLPGPSSKPTRMIELGSGSGIVGAAIAPLLIPGRDILVVTDLPEVCPLLEDNLKEHLQSQGGPLLVRPLSWGDFQHAQRIAEELSLSAAQYDSLITHIVCSDLVYFPELLAPLLRSLIQLSSPPFATPTKEVVVVISYKVRSLSKETPFWAAFGLWFHFAPVLVKMANAPWHRFGATHEDETFIFDNDLLRGVDVRGTSSPKGDDTFETLLLMSVESSDEP
ncbi:putative methyltransferase-domain-containing protein, partial [Mycena rebaudengoi]